MAIKQAKALQGITLKKNPKDLTQLSFNLEKQDQFIENHGVTFLHYKAIPSPLGLKDRGDYRRLDGLDTVAENGFIYKKSGNFSGVILGNGKDRKPVEGGIFDHSQARLTLPRYYDNEGKETIYLCPGDRVYLSDELDAKVVNYQRVNYNPLGDDYLQFSAICVEFLIDSQGVEYKEGVHFTIRNGNVSWTKGKKNPGIDPETGKGRVYSIRYKYNAHWYIVSIINEVRIGNTTKGSIRSPSRMPYQVVIEREYVYHNRTRGSEVDTKDSETDRTVSTPEESVTPSKYEVSVNIDTIE